MTEPRYVHAPDDAPLFRVAKALGGRCWPAYRAFDDKVVLDVDGDLVTFIATDVTLIARPESMPDWAIRLVAKVLKFEEVHGCDRGQYDWACFVDVLELIPADACEYVQAWGRLS